MNAFEQARQAYAPTQFPLKSTRSIEAQLFAKVTAALRKAVAQRDTHFPSLVRALHDNRQMWITLAVDLADDNNELPLELRAQLFSLAQFSHAHTQKVLQGKASADALIEINTAIMRGLNTSGVA